MHFTYASDADLRECAATADENDSPSLNSLPGHGYKPKRPVGPALAKSTQNQKSARRILQADSSRNVKGRWQNEGLDKALSMSLPGQALDECAETRHARFDPDVIWLYHDEEMRRGGGLLSKTIQPLRPDGQQPALRPRRMQIPCDQECDHEVGDAVITRMSFEADGKSKTPLRQGMRGEVIEKAADGAALIDFAEVDKYQWIYPGNFDKLHNLKAGQTSGMW
jgi:hypothetical protein